MEYRFSLTPRLVAVGLFSLVALFVLLFLLGMQVGQRTARPADPAAAGAPANDPLAAAQKKAADTESAVKQVASPVQQVGAQAPAATPAPATPGAAPAAKH
ncbi:hypothetical protein [Ramlibacter albus]|uniref:hypothetical protein n=1 Tax=Ramlibacter albus TaxID=2079448 RepID=UPI002107AB7B|nr:hypothetical protein [Ramlibacter albus]